MKTPKNNIFKWKYKKDTFQNSDNGREAKFQNMNLSKMNPKVINCDVYIIIK